MSEEAVELKELVGTLTRRETEVYELLGKGYKNPQIATILCITLSTVKAHVSSIFAKLKVDNRSKVAVIAAKIPDEPNNVLDVKK